MLHDKPQRRYALKLAVERLAAGLASSRIFAATHAGSNELRVYVCSSHTNCSAPQAFPLSASALAGRSVKITTLANGQPMIIFGRSNQKIVKRWAVVGQPWWLMDSAA